MLTVDANTASPSHLGYFSSGIHGRSRESRASNYDRGLIRQLEQARLIKGKRLRAPNAVPQAPNAVPDLPPSTTTSLFSGGAYLYMCERQQRLGGGAGYPSHRRVSYRRAAHDLNVNVERLRV